MNNVMLEYSVPDVGSISFGVFGKRMHSNFNGSSATVEEQTYTAIGLHGEKASGAVLKPRTITADLTLKGFSDDGRYSKKELDRLKVEATRILNPLNKGILRRTNRDGMFEIACRVSEVPRFEKVVGSIATASVSFLAHYPFWKSARKLEYEIGEENPDLNINNPYGVELPFVISGIIPANSRFVLQNRDTGQIIKSGRTYNYDREFTLDTGTCEAKVRNVGNSVWMPANFIFSFDSRIDMTLNFGFNTFKYDYDGTTSPLKIEISELLVGVN